MNDQLNSEEREILEKFERGALRSARGAEREMQTARQAARNTFNKTRRVNLRVTERDFNLAHARAREEADSRHQQYWDLTRARAGAGGRHPVSDALVQRYPQVLVGSAGREEIGRTSSSWKKRPMVYWWKYRPQVDRRMPVAPGDESNPYDRRN